MHLLATIIVLLIIIVACIITIRKLKRLKSDCMKLISNYYRDVNIDLYWLI